jgi:TrmH family RNA methyltransferase
VVHAFKAAARREDGAILLDGWHLLHDAVAAGIDVRTVAVSAERASATQDLAFIDSLAQQCDVFTVTAAVMDAMSPVRTPSGVVAIANERAVTHDQLLRPGPALILGAVDVQDPGNVGAIVRSAEAAGATGVLLCGISADPWSWKALRAAMGSTFRMPVLRVGDPSTALSDLRRSGVRLAAAVPRGGLGMADVDLRPPTALIVGSEGPGLTDEVLSTVDAEITIPMRAPVESLNVGVAAALLLYEARRQREA